MYSVILQNIERENKVPRSKEEALLYAVD